MRNGNQGVVEMNYIEQFWVPATSEHVTRVMNGVTVEARFRDGVEDRWIYASRLGGWANHNCFPWLDESRSGWTHCQVYAPPQWFLDKPEPGEGYRLLEKFPDEPVQGGDFAFDRSMGWIELRSGCNPTQAGGVWYRRRIEQPKPVFKVGDWVKIAKPSPGVANTRLSWTSPMDEYDGRITQISKFRCGYPQQVLVTDTTQWHFHVNWLTPAEQPKPEPKHYVLQVGDTIETPAGYLLTITDRGYSAKAP
jgi:hypothetical protein